jgi:hypothetical protein
MLPLQAATDLENAIPAHLYRKRKARAAPVADQSLALSHNPGMPEASRKERVSMSYRHFAPTISRCGEKRVAAPARLLK